MDGSRVSGQVAIAAVVIGRNEGARLEHSLKSVQAAGLPLVYVDSGSSDASIASAKSLKIAVVELDPARPFSAGRARNEGLEEAKQHWPDTRYIMFLDGDCVLDPGFPDAATTALEAHPDCAIVTGHLSERHPERSVYNRLCAIEWRSPAGPIKNMNLLGGIMMVRVSAFRAVSGFDTKAIAGEEPDLGVRLGLAGYSILKIDAPMASHDAHILTFRQWWTRAVRGGHALAHRFARHGGTEFRDGRRELMSALFWGLALPLAIVVLLWPSRGLSFLLLAGYGLLAARVYRNYRRAGLSEGDARLMSRFILYSKFAEVVGFGRYLRNRMRNDFRIIEYK